MGREPNKLCWCCTNSKKLEITKDKQKHFTPCAPLDRIPKYFPAFAEKMTRQKWTTPEQEAWLEERKPAFLLANQTKRAARNFYPDLVKEFRDKWPVPPVSEAEIADAGSVELATRVKKEKYDKVRTCPVMNEVYVDESFVAHDVLVSEQYADCECPWWGSQCPEGYVAAAAEKAPGLAGLSCIDI